jgi:5-methyltetrahydropteroyltriglutamate--homocysteine methyltransferase
VGTTYRADVLGSLLRPAYLQDARMDLEQGRIGASDFKRIEDRAVDQVIALQEGAGVDVVTDGELRRIGFIDHWGAALEGLADVPGLEVGFHAMAGEDDFSVRSPRSVIERIRAKRMLTVEEFAYARGRARLPVKVTLPSPLLLYTCWSPELSRDVYPSPFDLAADGVRLLREEIQELAALGCTYVQIDAPDLGTLVDPEHRKLRESLEMPTERSLTEGVDLVNAVAAPIPGVTFGLHLCKGNFRSAWIAAGGYESIAEHVFRRATNYDVFLLEWEDERSGSLEPLAQVPDDKVVALGFVSSKTSELEPVEQVVARIEEAAKLHPREQLAISTQCGFSTFAGGGNFISEETQAAKLKLVADVADEVWG